MTCGTGHCPAAQHPRQGTKQSSSVSFCTPASRMGRDKIKEVAEAVACLAFPWWYRNPREESAVSVQGVQLPASCTPPATRDKVMLSQATALCSVCNIYSHVTSCNSVIPGQNPNSKQPVGEGVQIKTEQWEEFSAPQQWLRCWFSPSFTMRVCVLWKCPTNLSCLVERFSAAFIVHYVERRRLRSKGEPEYLGLSGNGRKQKRMNKLLYFYLHETILLTELEA